MSYCRWSCDDYRCDLYCYEDVSGGWTTHVAGRRHRVPDELLPKPIRSVIESMHGYFERDRMVRLLIEEHGYEDIYLPHAGKTFSDPTLGTFRARIVWLRGLGYRCPDHVLDRIDQEASG